jgi:hypothetical protein
MLPFFASSMANASKRAHDKMEEMKDLSSFARPSIHFAHDNEQITWTGSMQPESGILITPFLGVKEMLSLRRCSKALVNTFTVYSVPEMNLNDPNHRNNMLTLTNAERLVTCKHASFKIFETSKDTISTDQIFESIRKCLFINKLELCLGDDDSHRSDVNFFKRLPPIDFLQLDGKNWPQVCPLDVIPMGSFSSLKSLWITNNWDSNTIAVLFQTLSHHPSLTYLEISHMRHHLDITKPLCAFLQTNTTLKNLYIYEMWYKPFYAEKNLDDDANSDDEDEICAFSNKDALSIAAALINNSTLHTFCLDYSNDFTKEVVPLFQFTLKYNTTLQELSLIGTLSDDEDLNQLGQLDTRLKLRF